MRRSLQYLFVGAALVVASAEGSCRKVSSIQPLFGPGDLVRAPGLAGVWAAPDSLGRDRWVFIESPDSGTAAYILAITAPANAAALSRMDLKRFVELEVQKPRGASAAMRAQHARDRATLARLGADGGGSRLFEAGAGRIGDALFLDMTPTEGLDNPTPHGPGPLTTPIHWFWRASLGGDSLLLVPLDRAWLGRMLDSGRVNLAHERRGDDKPPEIVLTAGTADLQRFVAAYAGDTAAFPLKNSILLHRRQAIP